jgi:hypothetical protein
MSNLSQKSFAGGVLSPAMRGNTNLAKYQHGLKTGRNGYIRKDGGFTNRPGTEFIAEVKWSAAKVRLIKFVFNDSQTYQLEFTTLKMRVYKDGVQQREAAKTITGITKASQCEITCVAHGYSTNDDVYLYGIAGMTELNYRWFKVVSTGANTFKIKDMDASAYIDSSSYTTYTSGGSSEKVYEITTPWYDTTLNELDFSQSADVITIVHPSYAPRELSRTGDQAWTLTFAAIYPGIDGPTAINPTVATAGAITYGYAVTSVDKNSGEESLAGIYTGFSKTITGITNANPGVFTSAAHGIVGVNFAYFSGVLGMTEINFLKEYYIVVLTANTFKLKNMYTDVDLDTTSFGTYTSGGTMTSPTIPIASAALSTTNIITLAWTLNPNASRYRIYRSDGTAMSYYTQGLIGETTSSSFIDTGLTPDYNQMRPFPRNPFDGSDNYPSTVLYAQQRRYFANTNNNPDTTWGSAINSFGNFVSKIPVNDASPLSFTLATKRVSEIQFLIEIEKLVAMTSGSEVILHGGANGFITPTEVNSRAPSFNGCGSIKPVLMGNTALYVQNRGTIVRDLYYSLSANGLTSYEGNDLTVLATHFFEGYTIVDWDFQLNPHPILWAVRSDGKVLSLTYERASDLIAWTIHDWADASVEHVSVIPEGTEDKVYFIIKRTIAGRQTKYIERMATRLLATQKDAFFLDSFITYDGRNTGLQTMTLSGGSTWLYDETITCTSSTLTFVSTDVGNQVHFYDADGVVLGYFTINHYTSATVVTGKFDRTVPTALRTTATTHWALAKDQITNLWHLEGLAVSVFADGYVAANPNNASYTTVTVSGGSITLDQCYGVIHVGLPFITDLETLDIDTSSGGRQANASQLITEVSVRLYESMGFWAGEKAPTDDSTDPLEGLYEVKMRDQETWDEAIGLNSEVQTVNIQSTYNKNGRVFVRNIEPVPFTVLSVRPTGLIS